MKKSKSLSLLLLTFFLLASLTILTPTQAINEENYSTESVGVGASEEETIDTFLVHPANRYTIGSVGWLSSTIDGLGLKLYEIGDGSTDYYYLEREVATTDTKIKLRFKVDVNSDYENYADNLVIELRGESGYSFMLSIDNINDTGPCRTMIKYYDTGGNWRTKTMDNTSSFYDDTWYVFEFDIDYERSICDYKLELDNGTTVFDYSWRDISEDYFPYPFTQNKITLRYLQYINTNGKITYNYLDYIDAPWKQYEWTQSDNPTAATWDVDQWHTCTSEDNVSDNSQWYLVTPKLDAFSGILDVFYDDTTALVDGDVASVTIYMYGVDGDDGGTHLILGIGLYLSHSGGNYYITSQTYGAHADIYSSTITDNVRSSVEFSFSLSEDRSMASVQAIVTPDEASPDATILLAEERTVSSVVTDPSTEFYIHVHHNHDYDGDTEATTQIRDFSLTMRDIFQDLLISPAQQILEFLLTPFILLFMFLAEVLKWLGDLLNVAWNFVGGLIIAAVVALEQFLKDIETAIGALWSLLEDALPDIVNWLLSALGAIISGIVDLLMDIIFLIYDGFWLLFGVTPAPDLIAWFNYIAANLGQGIADLITIIGTLVDIYVWWLFVPYYILIGYWVYFFVSAAFYEYGVLTYPIGLLKNMVQTVEIFTIPIPLFVVFGGFTFLAYVGGL